MKLVGNGSGRVSFKGDSSKRPCFGNSLGPSRRHAYYTGNAKQLVADWVSPSEKNVKTKNEFTEREIQVLEGLAKGMTNREIARKLFLTEGTVKNYISNIYSKLDVTGRQRAVLKAKDQGII